MNRVRTKIPTLLHLVGMLLLLTFPKPALANDVAVIVGVSDYTDPTITDLKFADEDARLFAKTLVSYMGFRKKDVVVLTSKPDPAKGELLASAQNITASLQKA